MDAPTLPAPTLATINPISPGVTLPTIATPGDPGQANMKQLAMRSALANNLAKQATGPGPQGQFTQSGDFIGYSGGGNGLSAMSQALAGGIAGHMNTQNMAALTGQPQTTPLDKLAGLF